MNFILTVLAAIVVLGPLVALHEWGHYIVARLCGVKVLTYSIGFGPKLLSWTSKKTGINYAVSAIPLGGYVKMLDEREGTVNPAERHLAFNTQQPWKKNRHRRSRSGDELTDCNFFVLAAIYHPNPNLGDQSRQYFAQFARQSNQSHSR